jgi:hypothetical protein
LSEKWLRILGYAATVAGVGISLFSGWIGDKKLDAELDKKVQKALEQKN